MSELNQRFGTIHVHYYTYVRATSLFMSPDLLRICTWTFHEFSFLTSYYMQLNFLKVIGLRLRKKVIIVFIILLRIKYISFIMNLWWSRKKILFLLSYYFINCYLFDIQLYNLKFYYSFCIFRLYDAYLYMCDW